MKTLQCNHDAQLVVSSASTMYIIKYQTKLNTEGVDTSKAMRKLVDRMTTRILKDHAEEQSGVQKTELQLGIRIFRSLLYEATNHARVPATMAAFLLMGGQTAYFSHDFANLNVGMGVHRRFSSNDTIVVTGNDLADFATDSGSGARRSWAADCGRSEVMALCSTAAASRRSRGLQTARRGWRKASHAPLPLRPVLVPRCSLCIIVLLI